MLRQLLTLLALITGLAATAAPAETRLAAQQGVLVQTQAENAAVAMAQRMAPAERRIFDASILEAPIVAPALTRQATRVETVYIGSDRAHE